MELGEKDHCTWFFENWYRYGEGMRIESFYIGGMCKKHDVRCGTTEFYRGMINNRVVGGIVIATVATIACWIRYPRLMNSNCTLWFRGLRKDKKK